MEDVERLETDRCLDLLRRWIEDPTRSGDPFPSAPLGKEPHVRDLQDWYAKRNERYLHHWFSSEYQKDLVSLGGSGDLITAGRLHPELPSYKKGFREDGTILYRKPPKPEEEEPKATQDRFESWKSKVDSFERVPSRDCESRGYPSFSDFALGSYEAPHTLLEFKWNRLYHEWAFDFFKLLDRRISSRNRIFLGVRPRQQASSAADEALDSFLREAIHRINKTDGKLLGSTLHPARVILLDLQYVYPTPGFRLRFCCLGSDGQTPFPPAGWQEVPWVEPAIGKLFESLKAFLEQGAMPAIKVLPSPGS